MQRGGIRERFINREHTKAQLGDAQGAMADCTAVIELEGAPKKHVARALANRAVVKGRLGDAHDEMADYFALIELDATPNEQIAHLMAETVALTISAAQAGDIKIRTDDVLRKFSAALGSLSNEQAREIAVHFLNALASPELKDTWPNVWRGLVAQLNPDVAEAVRFFEPVCNVLEGKDRTLLDALPPEQREFAVEVLAKFEPKAERRPAEAKETDTKRTRARK